MDGSDEVVAGHFGRISQPGVERTRETQLPGEPFEILGLAHFKVAEAMDVPALVPQDAVNPEAVSMSLFDIVMGRTVDLYEVAFSLVDEDKVNSADIALEELKVLTLRRQILGAHEVEDCLWQQGGNLKRRHQLMPRGLSPLLTADLGRQPG